MAIKDWSTTAASNNSASPNGAPEGMSPSGVNDTIRQNMADVRSFYDSVEWRDWGHTVSYASATTFTISGDVTSTYVANRPIKCNDASTLYGKISSSSYSAPNTTVTVSLDSGSLSASLSSVELGLDPTGDPVGVESIRGLGSLATSSTVSVAEGGTGQTSLTANNVIVGNGTSAVTFLAPGTSGNLMQSNGTAWQVVDAAASQAQMEAGSATTVFATPANTKHHPGVAKAWINFDGTTNTIRASNNVSSITDNGTGDYTINFTTAFSSANYVMVGTATGGGFVEVNPTSGLSTSSARIRVTSRADASGNIDVDVVCCAFFGDF